MSPRLDELRHDTAPRDRLLARLRVGEVSPERIRAAARCGHAAALDLYPGEERGEEELHAAESADRAADRAEKQRARLALYLLREVAL